MVFSFDLAGFPSIPSTVYFCTRANTAVVAIHYILLLARSKKPGFLPPRFLYKETNIKAIEA
jgi:hypothetical protein